MKKIVVAIFVLVQTLTVYGSSCLVRIEGIVEERLYDTHYLDYAKKLFFKKAMDILNSMGI